MTTRHCADHNGVAYTEECNVDDTDTMLPADTALCDRYRACEQTACGDVIGCVRGMFTQTREPEVHAADRSDDGAG